MRPASHDHASTGIRHGNLVSKGQNAHFHHNLYFWFFLLPCCALPPATLFYCYPLHTTFTHMIDCICRLSRENMRFFKIFQKSCEKFTCKFPVIFAATACGFGFRLLQPLVVGFSLSFCPVAESPIHSSLLLWYSMCDFGSLNVQRSLHHGMGYPSTRRDRPQL